MAAAGIRIVPAISTVSQSLTLLKFSRDSVEDIYDLIVGSEVPQGKASDTPNAQANQALEFGLELSGVSYHYPGTKELAVKNINLSVRPGMTIGIVGASGSGKSTLLNIILGFLKPTSGSIRHENVEIHDELSRWHSLLAYVPQSTFVTEGSIESNLSLEVGQSSIDYERLESALKQACLADFIQTLPEGLETSLETLVSGSQEVSYSDWPLQELSIIAVRSLSLTKRQALSDPETESQVLNTWSGAQSR